MRVQGITLGCVELNVTDLETCLLGSVEGDDPIVALGLVCGTEVVGSIGYLDCECALLGVGWVDGNFSHLLSGVG